MGATREIRTDVKIQVKELPVFDDKGQQIEGAIKRDWYLVSQKKLDPGIQIYVKTRKPWPSFVEVGKLRDRTPEDKMNGVFRYDYERVVRDSTSNSVPSRVTVSDRIAELEASNAKSIAESAELKTLVAKLLAKLGE